MSKEDKEYSVGRKLTIFNFITLNGFIEGVNKDISWHRHEGEENNFSDDSLRADNILLFGRKTYEMMYSFWPTPMAADMYPETAKGMNKSEKIVFSNTLKKADWNNTKIVGGDIVEEIKKIKSTEGKNMTILGSGSIVTQFSDAGLIDGYQLMIDPVAIGKGTTILSGLKRKLDLKLIETKTFKSGVVLLSYEFLKN
ncbi:MAG: dihydrofolate reductase [Ignavibacteria bacterium GWB2_35_6b]|nr:MAG: dihydrofolate reductase [Ignavibacteria bacterium GWB2_35_6b]